MSTKPKTKYALPKTHPKVEKGILMPFRTKRTSEPKQDPKSFCGFLRSLEIGDSFVVEVKEFRATNSSMQFASRNAGVSLVSMRASKNSIRYWRAE
jgi:hypothetical protein